jgi:anti-sigma factor RsiW
MTTHRIEDAHPTDLELAAWADEPETGAADVRAHVEACDRCAERVAEMAETRAALALDPPLPTAAVFAYQRERILEAIGAAPRAKGRVVRRIAWLVPLATAAAIAAIVLVGRRSDEAPLPVVADARKAAEEVAPLEPIDEDLLDAALAAAEPLAPSISVERSMTTEARFAELSEEEQSAVLLELASADLDL